jgi:anti-sigma regulatory factor (Ser/Thr protein kinase)
VGNNPVGDGVVADGAAGSATVRLAFPPQARLLSTVRLVVGIVARKAGIDEEGIEDLKVAVSETCAVAVADLARAGLSSPIELDLIEDGERFGVEVRDRAPADERSAGGFEMEDLDDRQFGLALVGALVDDLDSAPLEGGGHRTSFWLRALAGTSD